MHGSRTRVTCPSASPRIIFSQSRRLLAAALLLLLAASPSRAYDEVRFVALGSDWKYLPGSQEASPGDLGAWRAASFDDAGWPSGASPIGYGEQGVMTDLSAIPVPMMGNYRCLFLRQTFSLPDPAAVAALRVSVDYDDGIVIWINGKEIVRSNVPGRAGEAVTIDDNAAGARESGTFERFEFASPNTYLVAGTNVVAVQLFNDQLQGDDAFFSLEILDPYGPDVTPPAMAERVPAPGAAVRSLPRLEVTFDEAVAGVDASDLLVNGFPCVSVTGSGAGPYSFTPFEPAAAPGPVEVSWAGDHGIADLASPANPLAGGSWSCVVDPAVPLGNLRITEFLATNRDGIADEDGDREDWIELLNDSAETVELGGFSLTDDPSDPRKWPLPDLPLGPFQYLVIFASGKGRASGELHANFTLNASGGYLGLHRWDADAAVAEFSPTFPEQRPDRSYGLCGSGGRGYFTEPSPGAANPDCVSFEGFVEEPTASAARGLYERGALGAVALDCATDGAAIFYTTDLTEPSEHDGTRYAAPIELSPSSRRPSIAIRAAAFKAGLLPSRVVTFTYVFPDFVATQAEDPAGFPPAWSGAPAADYGMDPEIVAENETAVGEALRSIPSLSIVADMDAVFGSSRGVYTHPEQSGAAWERRASVELLFAEPSAAGFQVDGGIRIHGDADRSALKTPKHAFLLSFKGGDGPGPLRYPLFAGSPVTSFDDVVLRAGYGDSWTHEEGIRRQDCQYLRDQWARETILEMGGIAPRGAFVHVYLNGLYWGLYTMVERPDAAFAASHLGGSAGEYDALDSGEAVDGTRGRYDAMLAAANQGLESEASYQKIQAFLSVPDFIDYTILNIYGNNRDWAGRTWCAAAPRTPPGQWRFFSWAAERILERDGLDEDRSGVSRPHAAALYDRLRANAEFRRLFGDHLHRHFFNDGAMTPSATGARWSSLANRIDLAVVAESARWGDYRRDVHPFASGPYELYRRGTHWIPQQTLLVDEYFPRRSSIVLDQFRARGLYPEIGAPEFSRHGGGVDPGFSLAMSLPAGTGGTIYYTMDGSDPRVYGSGHVSTTARAYSAPIVLTASVRVRARTRSGREWSALTEAAFHVPGPYEGLRFTEIMYHPPDASVDDGDEYEFIELKNAGTSALDLTGVSLKGDVSLVLPEGSIVTPGQFVVVAANGEAFQGRYPGVAPNGVYRRRLSDDGGTIGVHDADGNLIQSVTFRDGTSAPWHAAADGAGRSLVPVDPQGPGDPNDPSYWRASSSFGGSPGADDRAAEPLAPAFSRHPHDALVAEGEPVRFVVAAEGWPAPAYQWLRNGMPIPGATGATYVVAATTLADSGARFRCNARNGSGTAASREATLEVTSRFVRGDANADGRIDIADAVKILSILFAHAQSLCDDANDFEDSGGVSIADPLALLSYLFGNGAAPRAPHAACGPDPTVDTLGCATFQPCRP